MDNYTVVQITPQYTLNNPTQEFVFEQVQVITPIFKDTLVVSSGGGLVIPNAFTTIAHTFSWGDASPITMINVPANKTIFKVEVILKTAFNSPSNLIIGDNIDPGRLFSITNLDLSQVGSYESNPNYTYSVSTNLLLSVTLGGGVTQGNGIILIYIQE